MLAPRGRRVLKSYPIPPPRRMVVMLSSKRCVIEPSPWTKLSSMVPDTKQLCMVVDFDDPADAWMRPPNRKRLSMTMSRSAW